MGNNNKGISMIDLLSMAKDLIKKGQALGDPELIQMGYNMLEEPPVVDEKNIEPPKKYEYVCSYCGQNITYDVPNRKKCPKCKKNRLTSVEEVESQPSPEQPTHRRATAEDFTKQIRTTNKNSSRIRYNDKGEPDGMYTRTEGITHIINTWNDDGIEGHDEEDDRIKKIAKVGPRNRPPIQMVDAICSNCKKTFTVHPMFLSGREVYTCDRCIVRKGRS